MIHSNGHAAPHRETRSKMGAYPQNGRSRPTDEITGLSEYVFGKVPPQALPLEEAVLGALMLDREAFSNVCNVLTPDSFYLEKNRIVYQAVTRLFEKFEPVDLLTVTEEIRSMGHLDKVDGGYYLVELSNKVASAANVEHHARIIAQKHIQRELIRVSSDTMRQAYEDTTDALQLLGATEQGIFEIATGRNSGNSSPIGSLMLKAAKNADLARAKAGLTGVPSGIKSLDEMTSGFQNGDLIIVAGRPGMGKTAAVLTFARNAAKEHARPIAVFSMEMPAEQLAMRLGASEAGIPLEKMRNGTATDAEIRAAEQAAMDFADIPIYIDDTPALTIFELRSKARKMKMKHGIEMVIVDYLQLMEGDSANREQEIAKISRGLKAIAKELQIPVIALSQLNRAVESRGGSKRPLLSDLRESGAVEQDADAIIFVYRPEYYKIMEDENGRSLKGVAEFIIAKHRNGPIDTAECEFVGEFARFQDIGASQPFTIPALTPAMPAFSRKEPDADTPF